MINQKKFDLLMILPGWKEFITRPLQSDIANNKKQQLLEMARNGEPKPIYGKHKLGIVLSNYINPNSACYDPEFTKQIKELRPDWFADTAKENKIELFNIARNGETRPVQKIHKLGIVLCHYTNPNSSSYDPEFDKEIRELRPDWFDVTKEYKIELLKVARNEETRPIAGKHKLGSALCWYTNPKSKSYDPAFDKEIRKLRPDWFVNTAKENKIELLKVARNEETRPIARKHKLGSALCWYTNPKSESYDPVFDKEIRELRPDWFVDTAKENKIELLKIARNGEPRPIARKHKLGVVLYHYTNPKSKCYDPVFDKEIRELRPDWFKK